MKVQLLLVINMYAARNVIESLSSVLRYFKASLTRSFLPQSLTLSPATSSTPDRSRETLRGPHVRNYESLWFW